MTPQEIERTLEFILEHQAQAATHIQRLAERQGEVQSMHVTMQSMFVTMTELAQVQSQRLDRHDEIFNAMVETQRGALTRLDQVLDRLTRDR